MKRLLSILVAAGLLFSLIGCQEKAKESGAQLGGQPDLKLTSVAKFLRSDGSWYLTEQTHEVFAEPKAIKLTAKEPFGQIIWAVQNGKAVVEKSPGRSVFDKELYELITSEAITKGLMELYVAGLGYSDAGSSQADEFTFEGRVYESVFADRDGIELYKNKSTGRKDLAVFQGKKRYVLYGYNYLKVGKAGYFPSKIDVYIYSDKADKTLIAQYICRLP
jgi:hypothetical protein